MSFVKNQSNSSIEVDLGRKLVLTFQLRNSLNDCSGDHKESTTFKILGISNLGGSKRVVSVFLNSSVFFI